jgi:hypothetical protein
VNSVAYGVSNALLLNHVLALIFPPPKTVMPILPSLWEPGGRPCGRDSASRLQRIESMVGLQYSAAPSDHGVTEDALTG